MGNGHSHDPHIDTNSTVDVSKLSEIEKTRYMLAHEQLHAKHRGHESMHAWMLLILIAAVIIAQVVLVEWKKRYPKSYQRVSLIAMWLIPFFVCVQHHWWRFIFFWIVFTILTCIIMSKAMQKPIAGTTPRLVYMWFYAVYMLSYALGVVGYIVIMLLLFGINLLFRSSPQPWMDLGILCLFYGLYYGVLGRDIAEIVTDRMATTIGYYTTTGVPVKQLTPDVCAVCGNKILVQEDSDSAVERSYKLSCDHVFHEFCIRGWCIVGKKQTCPYCKEKVDLKRMFCNPWERPHVFYGNFLDFIRYLVAWQPLILTGVQFINYSLGLE